MSRPTVKSKSALAIRKEFQKTVYQNRIHRDNFLITPEYESQSIINTSTASSDKLTYCYLCSINAHHHEKTKPVPLNKRRYLTKYENPVEPKEIIRSINHEMTSRYLIRVTTGSGKYCGTESPIFVSIRGSEGYWSNFELKKPNTVKRLKFEPGSQVQLRLMGPYIGDLYKLKVWHNAESAKDGWYLENIEVINLDTKKKWLFDCHRWLSSYRPPDFTKEAVLTAKETKLENIESSCIERAIYYVTAIVQPLSKAHKFDFDFNLFIEIIGDSNKTTARKLRFFRNNEDNSNIKNNNNNENLYHFNFFADYVPKIKFIRLSNDSQELKTDFVIETIIVKCFNIEEFSKMGRQLTKNERDSFDFKHIFDRHSEAHQQNAGILELLHGLFKRTTKSAPSVIKRATSADSFHSGHNEVASNNLLRKPRLKQQSEMSKRHGGHNSDDDDEVSMHSRSESPRDSPSRYNRNKSPASILKQNSRNSIRNLISQSRNVKFDRYEHYQNNENDEDDNESDVDNEIRRLTSSGFKHNDNFNQNEVLFIFACRYSINRNRIFKQNYELSSIVPFK